MPDFHRLNNLIASVQNELHHAAYTNIDELIVILLFCDKYNTDYGHFAQLN